MEMANTGNPQGSSRVFQFKEVSINNVSRLEVTKVPTPDQAADSLGGEKDARAAEILALAYFSRGDRENAIKLQERAITLQDNAKLKATYETQLAKYRVNEPKPVPFTPKVTPGAAAANAVPTGNPVGLPADGG